MSPFLPKQEPCNFMEGKSFSPCAKPIGDLMFALLDMDHQLHFNAAALQLQQRICLN